MTGRYKEYPEYKSSGVFWLDKIPSNWTINTVKRLTNFQVGWTPSTGNDKNFVGDNLWANISDLKGKYLHSTAKNISDEAATLASMDITPKGSLLYSFKLSVGSVSFAQQNMYTNEAIASFLSSSKLPLEYLYYALPIFVIQNASTNIYGARILNQELIKNAFLLEPSHEEAEKIVNFLDHETAKIDTLIAKQEKLIELLKEKRQAVISHAVTKGISYKGQPNAPMKDSGVEWLGEVPEHWVVIPNKRLFELTPKKSQIEAKKNELCNFIPMEKLKQDSLVLDEEKIIHSVFDGYTYFENEDILMAKVTPCFENKNMVVARNMKNGIGFGSSEIYVLRCNTKVNNDFMYYRLQEDTFMNIAISAMTGAGGLKRVPADMIMNFIVALPPLKEQKAIVEALKEKLAIFDDLSIKAVDTIGLMKERKTALISAAVTGKIDVRDWQPHGVQE